MQWVVVIKIYFVEKAEGGYISTMIQIIITGVSLWRFEERSCVYVSVTGYSKFYFTKVLWVWSLKLHSDSRVANLSQLSKDRGRGRERECMPVCLYMFVNRPNTKCLHKKELL